MEEGLASEEDHSCGSEIENVEKYLLVMLVPPPIHPAVGEAIQNKGNLFFELHEYSFC
jgi:hypothetical protein